MKGGKMSRFEYGMATMHERMGTRRNTESRYILEGTIWGEKPIYLTRAHDASRDIHLAQVFDNLGDATVALDRESAATSGQTGERLWPGVGWRIKEL